MNQVYETASKYLGMAEFVGAKHNPDIIKMYADAGNGWVKNDETPWCAAFVGSVLLQCGIAGTNKLNARSYLSWGKSVKLADAEIGDVVVLSRGKDPASGHVAFYAGVGVKRGTIRLLGGNQGDKVSLALFPASSVLGVRRFDGAPSKPEPDKTPPRSNPAKSTTVQASAVQIASGVTAGVTAVGALDGTAQAIALCFVGVIILTAAWIMRERLRKWAGGDK